MKLPNEVQAIIDTLQKKGFEAFAVGGCVRDLLQGKEPKDWDITTNAKPEQIQELFSDHVYENDFGTVAVKTGSDSPILALIEVTPYRIEGRYSDKRHPDQVRFADKLEEDLSRRDFTINALALCMEGDIVDQFGGQEDIKNKLVRTVGNPEDRFNEDALRMLRAVRFAAALGFSVESKTLEAIKKNAEWLRSSGMTYSSKPASSKSNIPSWARSDSMILTNSSRMRSLEIARSHSAFFLIASSVLDSMTNPSAAAKRTVRSMRKASSLNRSSGLPTVRTSLFLISSCPPN